MAIIKPELANSLQGSIQALSNNILSLNDNILSLSKDIKTTKESGMDDEQDREQMSLFQSIERYLKNISDAADREEDTSSGPGLGTIVSGIAATLGFLYGYLKEYIKAFAIGIKGFVKALDPRNFSKTISNVISKIGSFFKGLATKLGNTKMGKAVTFLVSKVKSFFGMLSKVGKFFGNAFTQIFKTVASVFKFFKNIIGYFSKFASVAGKFATLASRIFLPITVIIGIFNGITKAMERYKEGGFVAGVLGFIEGAINAVIMVPLDIIKSFASWIAEKLGWETISETLDSFSFEDMFSSVIDAILGIGEWFDSIGQWFSNKLDSVKNFFGFKDDEPKEMVSKEEVQVTKTSKEFSGGAAGGAGEWTEDEDGIKTWQSSGKTSKRMAEAQKRAALKREAKRKQQEEAKESMENMVFPDSDVMITKPKKEEEQVKFTKTAKEYSGGAKGGAGYYDEDGIWHSDGTASRISQAAARKSNTADQLNKASQEAELAKTPPPPKSETKINAPTTNYNGATTNQFIKPLPRNNDNSYNSMVKSKFGQYI